MTSRARLTAGTCAGLAFVLLVYSGHLYHKTRSSASKTAIEASGPSSSSLPVNPESMPRVPSPAAQPQSYTNEALHDFLAEEQKRMGIKKIYKRGELTEKPPPKDPKRERQMETYRNKIRSMTMEIQQAIEARKQAPVALQGDKTALLSTPENAYAARGAPLAAAPESPAIRPGGTVLHSQEELDGLWETLKSSRPRPRVNFNKQMLVVIIADPDLGNGVLISKISRNSKKWTVFYRDALAGEQSSYYEFQTVDKTDAPVVFKKLESSSTESQK